MLKSSFWHQKYSRTSFTQLIQVFNVMQTTIFPQHPSSYIVSNSRPTILLHSTQLASLDLRNLSFWTFLATGPLAGDIAGILDFALEFVNWSFMVLQNTRAWLLGIFPICQFFLEDELKLENIQFLNCLHKSRLQTHSIGGFKGGHREREREREFVLHRSQLRV
jgi:hypothetical protein